MSTRWTRQVPGAGYLVSQILVLPVLVGIFADRGVATPPDLYGVGWMSSFVLLLALLPSLVVGVIAGASRLLSGTVLALAMRVGAILLVVALGAWISFLGTLATFSFYEYPLPIGEYLGILAGTESSLALSWLAASGTTRLLERRARSS